MDIFFCSSEKWNYFINGGGIGLELIDGNNNANMYKCFIIWSEHGHCGNEQIKIINNRWRI